MINFVNKWFEIIYFNLKNSIKGTPKIYTHTRTHTRTRTHAHARAHTHTHTHTHRYLFRVPGVA